MATRQRTRKTKLAALDSGPYAAKIKRAGQQADDLLRRYGEPAMSLDELRSKLDQELIGVSLSELVVKEREAEW